MEKAVAPHSGTLSWKSHGRRSLVDCSPWDCEESNTNGRTSFSTFHFHALEKEMATHSSVLAWRIPGTAEPGGLPYMESHGVGHDWSNLAAAAANSPTLRFSYPHLLLLTYLSYLTFSPYTVKIFSCHNFSFLKLWWVFPYLY